MGHYPDAISRTGERNGVQRAEAACRLIAGAKGTGPVWPGPVEVKSPAAGRLADEHAGVDTWEHVERVERIGPRLHK